MIAYVALMLVALVPAALLRLGFTGEGTVLSGPLAALAQALADIRFGSGLRFWLGVTGATLMAALLLYPVRKLFATKKRLGSVGGWFHIHMLFGLGGPLLVLYHANLSLGGFNANVALWSMIVIVVSGIIGHFVYATVSAEFYWGKEHAREQLDAIAAALVQLDAMHPSRWNLIDALHATEVELLTPRKGILASIAVRRDVGQRLAKLWDATLWHVDQCAEQLGLTAPEKKQIKGTIAKHFKAYVRIARLTSTRSVREQIWARWRLFHLPLFLMMVVATVLHVMAVWGMDGPAGNQAAAGAVGAAPSIGTAAPPTIAPKRVRASAVQAGGATTPGTAEQRPAPQRPRERVVTAPAVKPASPTQAPAAPPASTPSKPRTVGVPAPPPVEPPKAVTESATAAGTGGEDMTAVYAKLKPLSEPAAAPAPPSQPAPLSQPPMSLGAPKPEVASGGDPNSLTAQIAAFKAKRDARQFSHSMMETGFELTGKHLKADCADCHKTPMRDTRQAKQRQCIDCHAKDDNHKGRRPNCVSCHTTNRWSQILRRN